MSEQKIQYPVDINGMEYPNGQMVITSVFMNGVEYVMTRQLILDGHFSLGVMVKDGELGLFAKYQMGWQVVREFVPLVPRAIARGKKP